MSTIMQISVWQLGLLCAFMCAWGFAIGAAIFYHVGRVTGYTQAANEAMRITRRELL